MRYFIDIIFYIMQMYFFFIILNLFLSWFPNLYQYKFFRACRKISDWYLRPFRGILVIGPLDLTPIFGLLLYEAILVLLFTYAYR